MFLNALIWTGSKLTAKYWENPNQLGAGGEPSTWFPPGKLVEHSDRVCPNKKKPLLCKLEYSSSHCWIHFCNLRCHIFSLFNFGYHTTQRRSEMIWKIEENTFLFIIIMLLEMSYLQFLKMLMMLEAPSQFKIIFGMLPKLLPKMLQDDPWKLCKYSLGLSAFQLWSILLPV